MRADQPCPPMSRVESVHWILATAPDSEEHRIGVLPIKIPPANRRCLDSNNGAKKSFDDQSPNLCPNQRAHTSKATSQVQGLPPPCLFHHDHVIVYI